METLSLYRIDDERPGSLFRLSWRGPHLSPLVRYAPLLAGLAVIVVMATVAYAFFAPEIEKAITQGGDAWMNLVPLGFMLLVGGGVLYNVVSFVGKAYQDRGRWTELSWDRQEDRFSAAFEGVAFSKTRSIVMPLSKIVSCEWQLGPDADGPLQLTLRLTCAGSYVPLEFKLEIDDLETRAEACELLLRIGRILQHSHFLIHLAKPRIASISTYQNPADADIDSDEEEDELEDEDAEEDDGDDESNRFQKPSAKRPDYPTFERPPSAKRPTKAPAPAATGPTKYVVGKKQPIPEGASGLSSTSEIGAILAGWSKRPFRVEQFVSDLSQSKLDDWRPGERVEIGRDGWTASMKWLFATVAGLVTAFVLGGPLFFLSHAVSRPFAASRIETGMAAFVVATFAAWLYLRPVMRARMVTLDWQRKMWEWTEGRERIEASFGDLVRVTVGVPRHVRECSLAFSPLGKGTQYEVQLHTRDRAYPIVETNRSPHSEDVAIELLLPFARALAESLRIPCRILPSDPSLATEGWRWPPRLVRYAAGTLCVLIALGVGQRTVRQEWRANDQAGARSRLVAAGAKVERVESRPAPGGQVVSDAWRVSFPNGIVDTQLMTIIPDLTPAGRVDLDLKATQVTDSGVRALGFLPNLVGIDLSDTRITNDGVDQFYRLHQIEHLNLSRTLVSDNGVSLVAMNNTLKVLELDGTPISDACMLNLRICYSLRFLSVADTRITEEGKNTIRGAIPQITVAGSSGEERFPLQPPPPPPAQ